MDLTITLSNELAQRLSARADEVNQSLDEVAASMLSGLLKQFPESTDEELWAKRNARRLELIQSSMENDLSSSEKEELQSLQEELYRRLEDSDDQLLSTLEKMQSELTLIN